MPRIELEKFCDKMTALLNPNGILLVEFMTTTKETKCHPFIDKFIFPDGAQFTLSTAIQTFERNKQLRLQQISCLDNDYYKTIKCWNNKFKQTKESCLQILKGNQEKLLSFELYLKWADFLYNSGRSRCYSCVWKKI